MTRIVCLLMLLFAWPSFTVYAGDLIKQDKALLRQTYEKGQEFYLIKPYLEGDWKGLHVYKIRPDAPVEFDPSWRDVVNPDHRLLRGDKVVIQSVKVKGNHLELRIQTIERKVAEATASQRFWGTALFGLAGMAGGTGKYNLQPQSKLRFFGDSADEIKRLVAEYLSHDPPKIELHPGMSPEEVKEVLGEPMEIFVFGNKKTFKYTHMDAIFIDNSLEDVVFPEKGIN